MPLLGGAVRLLPQAPQSLAEGIWGAVGVGRFLSYRGTRFDKRTRRPCKVTIMARPLLRSAYMGTLFQNHLDCVCGHRAAALDEH